MSDKMKILGLEKKAIVDAFTSGRVTVAIYGLGRMGLPLAAVFAERGAKVIGVDINQEVVDEVNICSSISQGLSRGDFVILETTVPPRTTKDVVLPILKQSGLREEEFGLAFCPERTASGRAIRDITGVYMKVVGGIDRDNRRLK